MVDFGGGYVAVIAALGGLHRARRDGIGCDADISLFDTALSLLVYVGTWSASRDHRPVRRGESAHPSIVPFQNFATADGHIAVAAAKQKFWLAFCEAIERPDLAADPRFTDFDGRDRHRDELLPILQKEFGERTTAEWLAQPRGGGDSLRSDQRRRHGARGPSGRRARHNRSDRPSPLRHSAPNRNAIAVHRYEATTPACTGAR